MEIKSRVPGKVLEIKVKVGDTVKIKDVLMILDAMKMKQPVPCPVDGTVKEIKVEVGERVNPGNLLMIIE